MNVAVRYYSRGGNTKKLADAIAKAVGVEAESVERPLDEKTDVVFLGSAVYANGVDEAVKRFLRKNQSQIGVIYNFSTAAIAPSTYPQIKKLADELEIPIAAQEYHCRGSFLLLHRGRPNESDLLRASSFAKLAVQREGKAGPRMADALDTLEKAAESTADAAGAVLEKVADAVADMADAASSEKAE